MNENDYKVIAQQLRKPSGEIGLKVAQKMNLSNELMNLVTIEKLNPKPLDHILELGMGNGLFVRKILEKEESIKYCGCDISELMIKEAEINNAFFIKKGQASFVLRKKSTLPFENNTFNKIFTINTLYFWDTPKHQLSEIKRVLKEAGELFISIRPKKVLEQYPFTKYGFTKYSEEDACNLLIEHGFKIIEVVKKEETNTDMLNNVVDREILVIHSKM